MNQRMANSGIAACALVLSLCAGIPGALHAQGHVITRTEVVPGSSDGTVQVQTHNDAGQVNAGILGGADYIGYDNGDGAVPIMEMTLANVPVFRPLIEPEHADLGFREWLTSDFVYVYDGSDFLNNCSSWEDGRPPWINPTVEDVTAVISGSNSSQPDLTQHLYLGLPLRKDPDWTEDEKFASFVESARQVGLLVMAEPMVDLRHLENYGKLDVDREVKLTEVCAAADKLAQIEGLQIATGRKVPAWEWDTMLLPQDEEYFQEYAHEYLREYFQQHMVSMQ